MVNRCLMISTKDRRKFFTHEHNLGQLVEFSKTFKAEISVVKVEEAQILDLEELAPAICDTHYTPPPPAYEVLEVKTPRKKRKSRREILQAAEKIRAYLAQNRGATLKELKKKFKKYELSDGTLAAHIRRAKT